MTQHRVQHLPRPKSLRYKLLRYTTLTVASLLAAAACTSSDTAIEEQELASIDWTSSTSAPSSSDGESEETAEPVDPEEVIARYEACMAEHGVIVSIVGPGGSPVPGSDEPETELEVVSPEAQEKADAECTPILDEAFGSFEPSPEQEAERSDAMLALQLCLSDAGFDIDLQGGSFEIPDTVDFAEFQAALSSCDTEAPSPATDS